MDSLFQELFVSFYSSVQIIYDDDCVEVTVINRNIRPLIVLD
jgi:hypothetical protein